MLPAQRRIKTVEQATTIVERTVATSLPEDLNNPFFPESMKPKAAPVTAESNGPAVLAQSGPSSNYELLEIIAPELTPSGTMILLNQNLTIY